MLHQHHAALTGRALETRLSEHASHLLSQLQDAPVTSRPRMAESVACDLATDAVAHGDSDLSALRKVLPVKPLQSVAGLWTALSLVVPAQAQPAFAREATRLRAKLPSVTWLDHIGASRMTGRALHHDDRRNHVWLVEVDNGLDLFSIVCQSDLDKGFLRYCGHAGSVVELQGGESPVGPLQTTDVDRALAGMSDALLLPGMLGVSTSPQQLASWVRWLMHRLQMPALIAHRFVDLDLEVLDPEYGRGRTTDATGTMAHEQRRPTG